MVCVMRTHCCLKAQSVLHVALSVAMCGLPHADRFLKQNKLPVLEVCQAHQKKSIVVATHVSYSMLMVSAGAWTAEPVKVRL